MEPKDTANRRQMWQEFDNGWATTIELMTAIGVWMLIGWGLDHWLGTFPLLLSGGAFLGFGLGMYMAYLRHTQRLEETAPERFRSDTGPTDGSTDSN